MAKKSNNKKKSKGLKKPAAGIITTSNAKKAVKKTASYAVGNPQTILTVAALTVGGYLLYKVFKGINKAGKVTDEIFAPGSNSPGGNTTPGGNTPPPINSGYTITENQASVIARIILTAMDRFGTDTQAILNALRGKTPADFHLISEKFGTPRYDGAGEGMWPAPERGLVDWLTRELDKSEMQKLKKLIPGIF